MSDSDDEIPSRKHTLNDDDDDDDELDFDEDDNDNEEQKQRPKKRQKNKNDDVEDEDEEEEEEEDDDDDFKDKKKRRAGSNFLELEAEVSDDEDDEVGDDDMGDYIEHDDDLEVNDTREARARAQRHREELRKNFEEDPEDMEKYIQERYGNRGREDEFIDQDEADAGGIEQQSLLPTVKDPKLYMVRTLMGKEREAAICLLQKHFTMMQKGMPLSITSVIAPEHLKGCIYVEAFRLDSVKTACHGLRILMNINKIELVPIREMVDILRIPKRPEKPKNGAWIRVNKGVYEGDLAQIYDVGDYSSIMVRMIPRIDYSVKQAGYNDNENSDDDGGNAGNPSKDRKTKQNRPPQALFDRQEIRRTTGGYYEIESQRDPQTLEVFDVYRNEKYKDGLLYKRYKIKELIVGNEVNPQIDELELFQLAEQKLRVAAGQDSEDEEAVDAASLNLDLSSIAAQRKVVFFKGDSVRFISSDLKGLTGIIESIDSDVVMVRCKELPEAVRCSSKDISKHFNPGDHIKVALGKHTGETGVVVDIKGEILTFFSDTAKEEVKVLAAVVVESSEIGETEAISSAPFNLFDLVSLSNDLKAKAVVIRVQNDVVTILETNGVAKNVPGRELRPCLVDERARVLDKASHPVAQGDQVRIIEGANAQRQGIVKHVADHHVFIQVQDETRNAGLIVARASGCMLQGFARGALNAKGPLGGKPTGLSSVVHRLKSPAHGILGQPNRPENPSGRPQGLVGGSFAVPKAGGYLGGGGRGAPMKGRDQRLGQDIIVSKGPHKGKKGKVVDASDKQFRIELDSAYRIINLDQDKVVFMDSKLNNANEREMDSRGNGRGGRTPSRPIDKWEGGTTPAWQGGKTPGWDGAKTPAWDGTKTPAWEGGKTPAWEGGKTPAWDGGRTPAWDGGKTPVWDQGTPGHDGMRTPAWDSGRTAGHESGRTPAYDSVKSPYKDPYRDRDPNRDPYKKNSSSNNKDSKSNVPYSPFVDKSKGGDSGYGGGPYEARNPSRLDPRTPRTPMIHDVMTPFGESADNEAEDDSSVGAPMTDIEVMIDKDGRKMSGYVSAIAPDGKSYTVETSEQGSISVFTDAVTLARPDKGDKIKVLKGDSSGKKGHLIGIDNEDGIVKLEPSGDVLILSLDSYGKIRE